MGKVSNENKSYFKFIFLCISLKNKTSKPFHQFTTLLKCGTIILLLLLSQLVNAQVFQINKIEILGNKKTKQHIILREMYVQPGDTMNYTELKNRLEQSRKNLYNSFLFNEIKFEVFDSTTNSLSLKVLLQERFYTFIIPSMEIADRNFNVWWVEKHHDLQRLNIGGNLLQRNIRGRNETMTITAQVGYTRQLGIQYEFPFIDKKLTKGLVLYANVYGNKEAAAITFENKQIFIRDDNQFIRRKRIAGGMFRYRPKIFIRHTFELNFTKSSIEDSLAKLNPKYFLNGKTEQHFFFLKYQFEYDHRDVKAYPLKGFLIMFNATQYGLLQSDNVKMNEFNLLLSKYFALPHQWYLYHSIKGQLSFPTHQPYYLQSGLGYGYEFVRGYEYDVIDGQHFVLNRNEIKRKIFNKKFPVHYKYLENLPFQIYLKAFIDAGYVVDKFYYINNPLNNSWLVSYGAGVDFVTAYDLLLRCEISRKKTGETGLFLHMRANF